MTADDRAWIAATIARTSARVRREWGIESSAMQTQREVAEAVARWAQRDVERLRAEVA